MRLCAHRCAYVRIGALMRTKGKGNRNRILPETRNARTRARAHARGGGFGFGFGILSNACFRFRLRLSADRDGERLPNLSAGTVGRSPRERHRNGSANRGGANPSERLERHGGRLRRDCRRGLSAAWWRRLSEPLTVAEPVGVDCRKIGTPRTVAAVNCYASATQKNAAQPQ